MPQTLKERLETAANVAIVVAVLFGVFTWWSYLHPSPKAASNADLYKVGETFPRLAGLSFSSDDPPVLVIFLNSQCRFCTDSMPFYRRLRQTRDRQRTNLRLVAISLEPADSLGSYLTNNGLTVDQRLAGEDASSLRLRGTPTLLLLDGLGVVKETWRGQLPKVQEDAVLDRLFGRAISS